MWSSGFATYSVRQGPANELTAASRIIGIQRFIQWASVSGSMPVGVSLISEIATGSTILS